MCKNCVKRQNCASLCPDAEAFVNQDYVPRREVRIPNSTLDRIGWNFNQSVRRGQKIIGLSHREWQVVAYLILTKPKSFYGKCCEVLGISHKNLSKILTHLRQKIIET